MKLATATVFTILSLTSLALGATTRAAEPVPSATAAAAAKADIKAALGFVPGFFAAFPDEGLPGAWAEFKAIQLNPKSAIPAKYKELIGLAVAAQIPCDYCVYFHTKAAAANGADEREIKEAVGMAATVRHWSTFLNGARVDEAQFQRDLDKVVANALAAAGKAPPPALPTPTDATSAKADIRATLGFVPAFFEQFPSEGLAGAWNAMKGLQLSPATAIPPKYKELIGLAVAAQVPCRYCVSFHATVAERLLGASDAELREAVGMAAIVRHWSTVLNGMQIDRATFKREVDRVLGGAKTGAR